MFRFRNALPAALALALTASLATPVSAANDAPAIDSNWMSDSRVLSASQARQALAQLPDDAPAPKSWHGQGGRIGLFGPAWADVDSNGCDTRNDILARDLARPTFKPGTRDCVVLSGTLAEPYTGATIEFQRGDKTSSLVQIDHVVALADAWRSGAWQWDAQHRQEFANDPENLLAVDGQANEDKSASSADQWLPPNTAFRCDYVKRQIAVKNAYGLSVTRAEQDALAEQLSICSG